MGLRLVMLDTHVERGSRSATRACRSGCVAAGKVRLQTRDGAQGY